MNNIKSKNDQSAMENQSIHRTKSLLEKKYQLKQHLTHAEKILLAQKVKTLYINKEFVAFIEQAIFRLPAKDKLSALYLFKKLAIQVIRKPDAEHFKAFEDEYLEELSSITDEQKHFEPVRWLNAEIDYVTNTAERLTADDISERLNMMQEAKQRLSKAWLTKDEVMELLRISKSTLNRRIAEGMPAHKRGKAVHFDIGEISRWLKTEAA